MPNESLPIYGLDKELAAKQAAKYDPQREVEARQWIADCTGEAIPEGASFHEVLKDGVLLCKLVNAIQKETTVKFNTSKMPFKQMENINNFLQVAEKIGVPKGDLFQTIDLFENKNMNQVIDSIFALSRNAVKNGFQGPLLGPKLAEKREVVFTEEQLNQGKCIIPLQAGFNGGASQAGMSFGGRRQIMDSSVG
ncbi:calponin domain-containing protein [Polychytrium aggregatum]|uniref:calponin domain-containing protein n=1 Tax=Polychytrium aggregatum TaxID=110093 RepID=UPI0022FE5CE1|nr:calponin domain-containing protein [Polychytrium aggregatum]KAI9203596.1 calponin homology domain-containing protein [Polychytrium aggregatum]